MDIDDADSALAPDMHSVVIVDQTVFLEPLAQFKKLMVRYACAVVPLQ